MADSAGGGIFNADGAKLHIQQSTLSDNASLDGGAIWTGTAMLTITASVLANNSARLSGGAVFCFDTIAKIARTTLSGNTAELGGGIASQVRPHDRKQYPLGKFGNVWRWHSW